MLTRRIPKEGRRGRVSGEIARRIQNGIAEGKLIPGEKLPAERDMAQRLKVSRVSVREAYRSLAELGILVVKRGAEGGAFITDVDHGPVSRSLSLMVHLGRTSHAELTEARLLLEPHIARLAAERADSRDLEKLEVMVSRQQASPQGDAPRRQHSLLFHRLVAECTKNLALIIVMNSLADLTLEATAQLDLGRDMKKHVLDFHTRIIDAIRRRDGDAAYKIMRSHIHDVQARLGKALARQVRSSPERHHPQPPDSQDHAD